MKLYEIITILTRASYWIKDNGEIIQSPKPEMLWHSEEAKKYFPDNDALSEALRAGWIRINAAGHYFNIQCDFRGVNPRSIRKTIELIKEIDILVTYIVEGNGSGDYKEFKSQTSVIRFLNQL